MTNDQPKAPMSAEQYIKTNGYRFEVGERMIMLKLLKDFAAQTCADKQAEIDKWQNDAAEQFRQLQLSKEETKRYKEAYNELADKHEELKARADKMCEAIKALREHCQYHRISLSSGIIDQIDTAKQEYESIDKGNKS